MEETRRLRREPPPYRAAIVQAVQPLTSWLTRLTLRGAELTAMDRAEPAASVRLLLPGAAGLIMPKWNGNEFLLPDGTRPVIRTFTPRNQQADRLDIDVVLHAGGSVSGWALRAQGGEAVAVSGPGRGSAPEGDASSYVLAGDETAVPAIAQLLETMPGGAAIAALIETAHGDDPAPMTDRRDTSVRWLPSVEDGPPGAALVEAVRDIDLPAGTRVWAAGEAAAMQQIRRHLVERAIPREHTTVRGYWKHGKAAGATGN